MVESSRATQNLPTLPVDILRKVLTNLSTEDLATCCRISRDLLDHARVQLYRHISVKCVSLWTLDEDDDTETRRYEYTTNSFRALCTLFAQPHLGKLVRSLEFDTLTECHTDEWSHVSTTPNDAVQTFTSLTPGALSLQFAHWDMVECLSALESVAPKLQELSGAQLERSVCGAVARTTKLRSLEVYRIDEEVPKKLLVALTSSLVHLSVARTTPCLPVLVNAAALTLRTAKLPMKSVPDLFQTKLDALVELIIFITEAESSHDNLYPAFSHSAPWWANYERTESLQVVTLSIGTVEDSAPHSESLLLGPGEGLFRRQLKRINFFLRLPLVRLIKSFSLLPATPPVRELGWTYSEDTTGMELEIVRDLCKLAGIEFYPSASTFSAL